MLQEEKTERLSQPTIVKYVETSRGGIQLLNLSRCAIGYVVRGEKHIYYGDTHHTISRGEMFYLGVGTHYVEDVPEEGRPFEQIVVYYSPKLLQRILLHLNMNYRINITNSHSCSACRTINHISLVANNVMRGFFQHVSTYLQEESFMHDETAENIKMTELVYLLLTQGDECLRSRVLASVDTARESFEQVIYDHLFKAVSIECLAEKTNRSLTSFKKEFRRHFNAPPHKWFVHQRLVHSRLLLISTNMSISEIGNECSFPNTSHYIKLFKRAYRTTPAAYRHAHLQVTDHEEGHEAPAEPQEMVS